MTTRIDQRFADLEREGRAGLVTFTMAGDPDTKTSLAILKELPKAGADMIELGMPFTDPMADGPAIQAGGLRALNAGQNMVKTLGMVRAFRKGDDATPIVLMGYYNPIYIYGVDRFLEDAKAAGVDGEMVDLVGNMSLVRAFSGFSREYKRFENTVGTQTGSSMPRPTNHRNSRLYRICSISCRSERTENRIWIRLARSSLSGAMEGRPSAE